MISNFYHFNEGNFLFNLSENNLAFRQKYTVNLVNQQMQVTGTCEVVQKVSSIALKVLFNLFTAGIFILTSLALHAFLSRKITPLTKSIDSESSKLLGASVQLRSDNEEEAKESHHARESSNQSDNASDYKSRQASSSEPLSSSDDQRSDNEEEAKESHHARESSSRDSRFSFKETTVSSSSNILQQPTHNYQPHKVKQAPADTSDQSLKGSGPKPLTLTVAGSGQSIIQPVPLAVPIASPSISPKLDEVLSFPTLIPIYPFTNEPLASPSPNRKCSDIEECKQVEVSALDKLKEDVEEASASVRKAKQVGGRKLRDAQNHLQQMNAKLNNQNAFNEVLLKVQSLSEEKCLKVKNNKLTVVRKGNFRKHSNRETDPLYLGVKEGLKEIVKAKKAKVAGWEEALNLMISHSWTQNIIFDFPIEEQQGLAKMLLEYNKNRLLDVLKIRSFATSAPKSAWPFKECLALIAKTGLCSPDLKRWYLKPNPREALRLFEELVADTSECVIDSGKFEGLRDAQSKVVAMLQLENFKDIYNHAHDQGIPTFAKKFGGDPYVGLFCSVLLQGDLDKLNLTAELFRKTPEEIKQVSDALRSLPEKRL